MSEPQEAHYLVEDTIPQYVNQSSFGNNNKGSPKACQNGDNVTAGECLPGSPAGSRPRQRSDFEFQNNLESSTQSNEREVGVDEQQSSSVAAMDEYSNVSTSERLIVTGEEVPENNESLENTALSDEESLDYGCVPEKHCNSSPLLGSDDETMGPKSPEGASRKEVHGFDNGPTNEQLSEAIRDIPASVNDLEQLTTKQALLMLEEQFSCSLQNKKKFIIQELTQSIQASPIQDAIGDDESLDSGGNGNILTSNSSNSGEEGGGMASDDSASEETMAEHGQERKAYARRAQAKAKMHRFVRVAKRGKARRGIHSSGAVVSSSESDSNLVDSDSDHGSTVSSARAKPRRKSRQQGKKAELDASASSSDEGRDGTNAAGSNSSKESGSDLEELPSDLSQGRRGTQGKGKGKRGDKKKSKTKKRKSAVKAVADDDGGSALLDSDDEKEQSKAKHPSSLEEAVVQEELEDVDEEKVKERKRIAAERQRQLDALRVMNAAQLKEATRAQQEKLLAKIKERQTQIHAEIAAAAKEELKLLKAEARKAAGITDVADEDENEGDVGETVSKLTGPDRGKGGGMDIEEMVAKEEAAAAAVVAGNGGSADEEGDGDFVSTTAAKSTADNASRSSANKNVGDDDESEESASSDSDFELEILPANSKPALNSLVKQKENPLGASKMAKTKTTLPNSGKEGSRAAQEAAARALAALPKGMRFSSPKMADTVRAANRRRLVASARAVASNRWATQLGYQDGQEHIRDLKYMELKRRQQAHRERERKAKEKEAMEARLREYEANADAEEEEFEADTNGDDAAAVSPIFPDSATMTSVRVHDGGAVEGKDTATDKASDETMADLVHGKDDIVHSPNGGGENIDVAIPSPNKEAKSRDAITVDHMALEVGGKGNLGAERSAPSTSSFEGDVPRATQDVDRVPGLDGVEAAGGKSASMAENPSLDVHDASNVLPPPRPKIVRTYGRKTSGLGQIVKSSDKASEPLKLSGSMTQSSTEGVFSLPEGASEISPESQALWEEEPDSEPAAESNLNTQGPEEDSCGMSLNLHEDGEELIPPPSEGSVSALPLSDEASEQENASVKPGQGAEVGITRALQGVDQNATSSAISSSKVETVVKSAKMKLGADGKLVAAPTQPSLPLLFKNADKASSSRGSENSRISLVQSSAVTKKGIAAFFCANSAASGGDKKNTGIDVGSGDINAGKAVIGLVDPDVETPVPGAVADDVTSPSAKPETAGPAEEEHKDGAENENRDGASEAVEGNDVVKEDEEIEKETVKKPKDRSAKFREMLEAEREANRRAKKLRKTGMMDEEAEEEEEEEAVRGLGDFGFGVPAGGTGTSASGGGTGKKDEEEDIDEEIRDEDLEGIVDTFSDDEGDKDAQDAFLNNQAAAGERQALKDMVRRVREGFGEERGGRGRGSNARGNLRLDELTAADRSSRKEARRLGLLNSDEEWSDEERGEGNEKDELDELDEVQLGELLAREQRARHMGLSQTAQEYLESSDSEEEGNGEDGGEAAEGKAEEDEDRREEARIQKLWVKRAKRRRVLAEVEQAGAVDSQSSLLIQEDEDSQAILSSLHCTNSRLGVAGLTCGGIAARGDGPAESLTDSSSRESKRRTRDRYAGELNSQEVENGFGMGMSSKLLKRAKSNGSEPREADQVEADASMNRAFTMPQFVTSVAGYGGSTRAKQRKGSFLSRSRSLQARSGSLAAGKTTVSASKFVFVSSISGGDDTCARTGFEEPALRESSSNNSGDGDSRGVSASAGNVKREKAGAFSGIGDKGKGMKRKADEEEGAPEMGRLWKGLCAGGKQKSRR